VAAKRRRNRVTGSFLTMGEVDPGYGELYDRELGAGVAQAYRQKFQTIPDKNLAISD